jgi:hypothetical protein
VETVLRLIVVVIDRFKGLNVIIVRRIVTALLHDIRDRFWWEGRMLCVLGEDSCCWPANFDT